jgi:hypothetical protein
MAKSMVITKNLAVKVVLTLLLLVCARALAFSNQFYTDAMQAAREIPISAH